VDRLVWAKGGDVIRIEAAALLSKPPVNCTRGTISEFSHESRHRLMTFVNSINRQELPPERVWFVTLTYPGIWPDDPQEWKRDLQTLRKRLERVWGVKFPAVWKLEPQRRGAPHFHLLLLVPARWCDGLQVTGQRKIGERTVTYWAGGRLSEFRQWLSRAWFEVVDSGDERHLRAGTNCEPIEAWGKVAAYASKYLGKECRFHQPAGEPMEVGRYWGVWHRELFPIEWKAEAVPFVVAARARRVVRRWVQRRWSARHLRGRFRSATVFAPAEMIRRVIVWATATIERDLVREWGTLPDAMQAVGFNGTARDWYHFGERERQDRHRFGAGGDCGLRGHCPS
jgi:hypothetical protein